MKQFIFTIFLLFVCIMNLQAQDEIKVSELTPCQTPPKLTKSELKRIRKLDKDITHINYSEPIKTFIGIEPIILSNGKEGSLIKSQMNSYELVFQENNNGDFQGRFNFFIRISSVNKRIDGCFEEMQNFTVKKEDLERKVWLNYNKVFELPKDKYIITFVVRDIETGLVGVEKISFEVN